MKDGLPLSNHRRIVTNQVSTSSNIFVTEAAPKIS
jgi:hypothetical protein